MKETLAQIYADGPRPFTAGIVLWNDVVVEAAPIIGFMKRRRWTRDDVRNHCKKHGWKVEVVHELERSRT